MKIKEKLEVGHPVRSYVDNMQPDILFLVETQSKHSYNCPNLPFYKRIFKKANQISVRGRPSGGICAYVSNDFKNISIIRSKNENILAVGIKEKPMETASRTWVICIYIRPQQPLDYYEKFFQKLREIQTKIHQKDEKVKLKTRIFYTGDFNIRLGCLTNDLNPKGKPILHPQSEIFMKFL